MSRLRQYASVLAALFLFVIPVSPNFQLRELDIGNGGGGTSNSANYGYEQVIGQLGSEMSSANQRGGFGFGFTQMANVPGAPTFTNAANNYDKLHLVINTSNNPSDTKFAIAISTDNFTTTNYVKADDTVGASLSFSDYQTYASWGSGTGFDVIGLQPNTTYTVKVKAFSGSYTESGYGPTASAATVNPSLSFDIDVAPTDQSTSPPYSTNLGTLLAGTVATGTDKIWVSLDTNANNGGTAYIASANGGLKSTQTSTTIVATTGDLASLASGFGLQVASVSQTSGGPLSSVSPFNGASQNVGAALTNFQSIFTSTAPVTAGRGSISLKAKASDSTPSASDYTETLTVVGSANF